MCTAEFGIRGITRCSCDSTMKLGHRRTLSLAKGESTVDGARWNVRERRMRSSLIPLFMRKFIFAERLSVRRCISNLNEHRSKGGKIKHANGERRNAKGPAVNLSTSSPPTALGICWSRRTTRTYIRETLCQALSRRTTPSYGHHPQFAFLKGAQKPPEIAAGSSDVTAGSISVPLDRSSPPPPPLSHSLLRSRMSLFIYLPLLPSTISRVGTYRGGKSSDNGGFG